MKDKQIKIQIEELLIVTTKQTKVNEISIAKKEANRNRYDRASFTLEGLHELVFECLISGGNPMRTGQFKNMGPLAESYYSWFTMNKEKLGLDKFRNYIRQHVMEYYGVELKQTPKKRTYKDVVAATKEYTMAEIKELVINLIEIHRLGLNIFNYNTVRRNFEGRVNGLVQKFERLHYKQNISKAWSEFITIYVMPYAG